MTGEETRLGGGVQQRGVGIPSGDRSKSSSDPRNGRAPPYNEFEKLWPSARRRLRDCTWLSNFTTGRTATKARPPPSAPSLRHDSVIRGRERGRKLKWRNTTRQAADRQAKRSRSRNVSRIERPPMGRFANCSPSLLLDLSPFFFRETSVPSLRLSLSFFLYIYMANTCYEEIVADLSVSRRVLSRKKEAGVIWTEREVRREREKKGMMVGIVLLDSSRSIRMVN